MSSCFKLRLGLQLQLVLIFVNFKVKKKLFKKNCKNILHTVIKNKTRFFQILIFKNYELVLD